MYRHPCLSPLLLRGSFDVFIIKKAINALPQYAYLAPTYSVVHHSQILKLLPLRHCVSEATGESAFHGWIALEEELLTKMEDDVETIKSKAPIE